MAAARRLPATLALSLSLASCTILGPDFEAPAPVLPAAWSAIDDADSRYRAAYWWRQFEDPVLDELIAATYAQNLDLQSAGLRILQARAALGIADGLRFPQQQAVSGALLRGRMEDPALEKPRYRPFNTANLNFDVAWEMDIWGKYARGIESAEAALYAAVASYDDVLISLTAEVARNYVDYRAFQERILLAEQNSLIQQRVVGITEIQYESGNVTELDVQQARTQLYSTQSLLPALRIGKVQTRNAIAVLVGQLPEQVEGLLSAGDRAQRAVFEARTRAQQLNRYDDRDGGYESYDIVPSTPPLRTGIDASLVARRPDLRVAELQARAQSARIGLTQAELYPQFTLSGSIGLNQTVPAGTAFTGSDAVSVVLGPGFRWNIFNYGRIRNQVRVEDARFQESLTHYNQAALRAVQEVSNAIEGYRFTLEEEKLRLDTVQASVRAFSISMTQYQDGLVSYQRLLSTVEKMTRNEDLYAQSKAAIAKQVIALYKALGGGWQMRSGRPFVAEAIRQQMGERTDWGKYLTPPEDARP